MAFPEVARTAVTCIPLLSSALPLNLIHRVNEEADSFSPILFISTEGFLQMQL